MAGKLLKSHPIAARRVFIVCTVISVVGGTSAVLGLPVAAVEYAPAGMVGLITGGLLVIEMFATVVAVLLTRWFVRLFGVIRGAIMIKVALVFTYCALATVAWLDFDLMGPLIGAAVILGAIQGVGLTLGQMTMAAFYTAGERRKAAAILVASFGAATIGGTVIAGLVITKLGFVAALGVAGACAIPGIFALLLLRIPHPIQTTHSDGLRILRVTALLRTDENLRAFLLITAIGTFAVGPIGQLIVPVTCQLCTVEARETGPFLLAIAVGGLAVPMTVRIVRNIDVVKVGVGGYMLAGFLAASMALSAVWLDSYIPQAVFILLIVFSVAEGVVASTIVGSIQDGANDDQRVDRIAMFYLTVFLGLGFGGLVWGLSLDLWGAAAILVLGGTFSIVALAIAYPTIRSWSKVDLDLSDGAQASR